MRRFFAPGLIFVGCVLIFLALAALGVWLAASQPWLGLDLRANGAAVEVGAVDLPTLAALQGAVLTDISAPGSDKIALDATDITAEPDQLADPDRMVAFFAKQDAIAGLIAGQQVTLGFARGGVPGQLDLTPAQTRPLADLPVALWTQLFVALVGLVIGAWVVSLRPRDPAAWLLLVAGVGLAMAAGAAALYSTRELALSYGLFAAASRFNTSGTLLFGIGMVTLFLIYPRRIVPGFGAALPALAIGAVTAFIQLNDWPRHLPMLQSAVAATMLALLVAIGAQVVVNRRDPASRAMLGWFGLSVALGAGGFVLTAIVPTLLGREVLVEQSTAFLFFLLIFAGIAVGVARYRLFDLATWSLSILSYGIGVVVLLLLDAALIYGLSLDRAPALGLSLAVVGLIYLPMRGRLAQWLRGDFVIPVETLFARVTQIAQVLDPDDRVALLRDFWRDVFNPLSITPLYGKKPETALHDDGAGLTLGAVHLAPAMRLDWARGGRRLFSSADLEKARSINALIDTSIHAQQKYLEAITTERTRINRDMHDNIGVLLLSALHSSAVGRKDQLIRQTLTDLREIISNPDQSDRKLSLLLADLRAEIVDLFEAAGIQMDWHDGTERDVSLDSHTVHTVRAILREGASNVVRHAQASKVAVNIADTNARLEISLRDNGQGFNPDSRHAGQGFGNIAARIEAAGGQFTVSSEAVGTVICASLPLHRAAA